MPRGHSMVSMTLCSLMMVMMVTGASSQICLQVVTQQLTPRLLVGIKTGTYRLGMQTLKSCWMVGSMYMQLFAALMTSSRSWRVILKNLLVVNYLRNILRAKAVHCVDSSTTGSLPPSVVYLCWQQVRMVLTPHWKRRLRTMQICGTSLLKTSRLQLNFSNGNHGIMNMVALPRVWLWLTLAMLICGKHIVSPKVPMELKVLAKLQQLLTNATNSQLLASRRFWIKVHTSSTSHSPLCGTPLLHGDLRPFG